MEDSDKLNLEQIRAFLEASQEVGFVASDRAEVYGWVERTLRHHDYAQLARSAKGLVRRYVAKMTGLSRAQTARLIRAYHNDQEVKPKAYRRRRFPSRYTRADIEHLAEVDNAHESLSGPATQKLLQRAFHDYGDARFQSLAAISVAQIYRLRKTARYRERHAIYQHTRPTAVAIGERRKPDPQGRPGFLRVDTVHQGDADGVKGLYHINAVDEVTQWQVVGATPHISEAWLLPVLEAMQCGALVITSRDPAILEVSGDGAVHVDGEDTTALAEAMRAAATNPNRFDDIRQRALARAAQFSWRKTARLTREVYGEAGHIFHKA